MTTAELPQLYTIFNGCALFHIILGVILIKKGIRQAHIASMVIALLFSAAFLGCYLYYHFTIGHVRYAGQGLNRTIYFTILLTHIPLAILNLPMILLTVIPAIQKRYDKHRRMTRWTLPIWLYVSATGILIYFMCYVWYGPPLRS
jgi:putative membrane protein